MNLPAHTMPRQVVSRKAEMYKRIQRAEQTVAEIRQAEHELDLLFFKEPAPSIAPAPPHFFRAAPHRIPAQAPSPPSPADCTDYPAVTAARLGYRVRRLREMRHLTQQDLALATGIRRPNIARLEKGTTLPNISTLFRIARALSISPAELLIDRDIPEN